MDTKDNWTTVRIRTVTKDKIEGYVRKHPQYGTASNFIDHALIERMEKFK